MSNTNQKSCAGILRFIRDVIASGRAPVAEHVLNWLAWKVQNPLKKPGTNLVLIGGQGTGKSTLGKMMCDVFGPRHSIHVTHEHLLLGRFNGHLEGKLFMVADEALFGRNPAVVGVYKGLTTEETMLVERKGIDARQIPNRLAIMVLSNSSSAVPVEPGDRRATVIEVSNSRKEDNVYFGALWDEWENGGREAFIAHLLARDLKGYDPRRPLATREKAAMAAATADPITRFWLETLANGNVPGPMLDANVVPPDWNAGPVFVFNQHLAEAFNQWAHGKRLRHEPDRDEITRRIGELCPMRTPGRRRLRGNPERGFTYPKLSECRDAANTALSGCQTVATVEA